MHEHSPHCSASSWSRRELIAAGMVGGALFATLPGESALAAPAAEVRSLIDVHHHFNAPAFVQAWENSGTAASDPVRTITKRWSPAWMIDQFDQSGIATAILSNNDRNFTATLAPASRASLSRQCNDYAAKLAQLYPGRIQFFANLPMPDVDASLAEISHSLDILKAVGVHMMTSYGDRWPGDPSFRPILEELNRRNAVVFCHPRIAKCCDDLMPSIGANMGVLLEYPYDTGRAVLSLLVGGAFATYPNIKWIFCHLGSVIAPNAHRLAKTIPMVIKKPIDEIAPKGVDYELKRLYWDTALANSPAMRALLDYSPASQVLFGSDAPIFDVGDVLRDLRAIGLPPPLERAIEHDNAVRLMPRLAQRS